MILSMKLKLISYKVINSKVLVIGDICVDKFVQGSVHRISPEAPVPVFNFSRESQYVGCAANVAISLSRLGLEVDLISLFANDPDGNFVMDKMISEKVGIENTIQENPSDDFFTSIKTRIVSDSHHICRIDKEPNPKFVKKLINENFFLRKLDKINHKDYELVIISDYGKGIINNESYKLINELIKVPLVVDPKPSNKLVYKNSFIVKPNLRELVELLDFDYNFEFDNISRVVYCTKNYIKKNNIKNIIVTDGSNGSYLINEEQFIHYPAQKVEVYDVSGAGDSFLSALVFGYIFKKNLSQSIEFANKAASTTIIHSGTTPLQQEDIEKLGI